MNGPNHYKEAERLIHRAGGSDPELASQYLAEAQVHATLALAAATLHSGRGGGRDDNGSGASSDQWREVTR